MRSHLVGVLVVVVGLTALVSGYAVAQQAGSPKQLRACVQPDGLVRMLRGRESCRKSEPPITWNIAGPTGPAGQNGAPGPMGPQGPAGGSASGTATSGSTCMLGEIRRFGGDFAPRNWHLADGSLFQVMSHTALFSILGSKYGGDGRTTFALPNLNQSGANGPQTIICMEGFFPARS